MVSIISILVWRKPPHWSILIFLSDWFYFADFSFVEKYDFGTKNDFSQSTVWFYFINYSRSFRIILSKRKTITDSTIYRAGTVYRQFGKKSDVTPVWLVVWESDVPLSQMKNGNITLFRNPEWFWMILNYSDIFFIIIDDNHWLFNHFVILVRWPIKTAVMEMSDFKWGHMLNIELFYWIFSLS